MSDSRVNGQSVSFGPKLRAALNDVLGGGAASVLTITFGLSYSLLNFAGPLAPYLSYGVAVTFISTAVLATVIALGSSLPFAIAGPGSSTAAVTAILPSSLVERTAVADTAAPQLAPVLITLGLSTIVTGIVLCGFGLTRMGRAIRYVPYPVVGGFLGGIGCLLLLGAIRGSDFSLRHSIGSQIWQPVRTGGSLRNGPCALSDLVTALAARPGCRSS
jgi:sulfate permease, SulP family